MLLGKEQELLERDQTVAVLREEVRTFLTASSTLQPPSSPRASLLRQS